MSLNQSAEENLRMIRSLMERTATYRSISVPSAAWAGGLSVAALLINLTVVSFNHEFSSEDFLLLWLGVLALAALGNTILLYKDSRRTGSSFPSPPLLSALWGMVPAFFVAAMLTGIIAVLDFKEKIPGHWEIILVLLWQLCYGLGLLGTQHFAPRSVIVMGWAFLVSGLALAVIMPRLSWHVAAMIPGDPLSWLASAMMAATFGAFHLLYAACVYASPRKKGAPATF